MPDARQQNQLFLRDVLSGLMEIDLAEYNEVRFVAHAFIGSFKKPAHKIKVSDLKVRLRYFPLYLS